MSITIDMIDGWCSDLVLIDQGGEIGIPPSIILLDTIGTELIDTINSYSQEQPSIKSCGINRSILYLYVICLL